MKPSPIKLTEQQQKERLEAEKAKITAYLKDIDVVNIKHKLTVSAKLEFKLNKQGHIIAIVAMPSVIENEKTT